MVEARATARARYRCTSLVATPSCGWAAMIVTANYPLPLLDVLAHNTRGEGEHLVKVISSAAEMSRGVPIEGRLMMLAEEGSYNKLIKLGEEHAIAEYESALSAQYMQMLLMAHIVTGDLSGAYQVSKRFTPTITRDSKSEKIISVLRALWNNQMAIALQLVSQLGYEPFSSAIRTSIILRVAHFSMKAVAQPKIDQVAAELEVSADVVAKELARPGAGIAVGSDGTLKPLASADASSSPWEGQKLSRISNCAMFLRETFE